MFREVPLTGCQLSLLPRYRYPQESFQIQPVLNNKGLTQPDSSGGDASQPSRRSPWQVDEMGRVTGFIKTDGAVASQQEPSSKKSFSGLFVLVPPLTSCA